MIYLIAQDLILSSENLTLNIISQIQLLAKNVFAFFNTFRIMIHSTRNQTPKHSEESYTVRQKPPVQFIMLDQFL